MDKLTELTKVVRESQRALRALVKIKQMLDCHPTSEWLSQKFDEQSREYGKLLFQVAVIKAESQNDGSHDRLLSRMFRRVSDDPAGPGRKKYKVDEDVSVQSERVQKRNVDAGPQRVRRGRRNHPTRSPAAGHKTRARTK